MTNEAQKKESSHEDQLVVFRIGQEEFGVGISEVREIIRMEQVTKIPNSEEYIKGVINLRGKIIIIIDLALKLGLPPKEADKNTRIIVINIGENTVGMIVDSATEVIRLSQEQIKEAPRVVTEKINATYIDGVGIIEDRLFILLDLAKVLSTKEISKVHSISKQAQDSAKENE